MRQVAKLIASAGLLSAPVNAQDSDGAFLEAFDLFAELPAPPDPSADPSSAAVDLSSFEPPAPPEPLSQIIGSGRASYYGKRFHGRRTANGERFDMHAMTAAHPTLPFGSKVRVTNARTGRQVIVRINDRGPFAKSRVIDLSRAAAKRIGMISRGHAKVELELLN